jgi:Tfp pilus assembly protein PilO
MSDTVLTHADKWQILAKFFIPSLIGLAVLVAAYIIYRWKIRSDQLEMENLKSDRLKLQMEALAAEKKAQRKNSEEKANLKEKRPIETPPECIQDEGFYEKFEAE